MVQCPNMMVTNMKQCLVLLLIFWFFLRWWLQLVIYYLGNKFTVLDNVKSTFSSNRSFSVCSSMLFRYWKCPRLGRRWVWHGLPQRWIASLPFPSFGVAHCFSVNDDILYFWAADLRLDSSCICIYIGNILLLGWLYEGFCSGTDFQPIVVLYSAVGDLKEIPFLDQRNVVWPNWNIYSFCVPRKSDWSTHYNLLAKTRGNVVVNIPKAVPLVLSTICHFLVTQCILHMCWKGVLWIHFAQLVLTNKVKIERMISQGNYPTHKSKFLGYLKLNS